MKFLKDLPKRSLGFTLIASAGVALLYCGCCSESHTQTAYTPSPAPAATGGTAQEEQPAPAAQQAAATTEGQTNMVIPLMQESVKVGKREVDAGTVRVKKIVKTETINQPIELRHEEVAIERESGGGTTTAQGGTLGQPFEEQEMVIHLKKEEPVIQKDTVSAGQVVIRKSSTEQQQNIQAQVRKEDVDIARSGESSTGGAESPAGQATGSSTITQPGMLFSSTPDALDGRQVQLSGVHVDQVIDSRLLVLSDASGQKFYAVGSDQTPALNPGATCSLSGTVKRTAGSMGASGLKGDAAQTLTAQPFYIDISHIEASK